MSGWILSLVGLVEKQSWPLQFYRCPFLIHPVTKKLMTEENFMEHFFFYFFSYFQLANYLPPLLFLVTLQLLFLAAFASCLFLSAFFWLWIHLSQYLEYNFTCLKAQIKVDCCSCHSDVLRIPTLQPSSLDIL